MRKIEAIDGLAILGRAALGPATIRTPAVLLAGPEERSPGDWTVASVEAPAGERHLTLSDGQSTVELRVPILAPEIAPDEPGVHRVADRAFLVHFPVSDSALAGLRSDRPELVVLGNARALWTDGEPFVRAIGALRRAIGPGPLLWAPRTALPDRLPLLAYLGVDLLDTTEGEIAATRGTFLDADLGQIQPRLAYEERSCDCPACRAEPRGSLAAHAKCMFRRSLGEVRAAVRAGRLRELVEARLSAEPALSEMLRYADRGLADLLEESTPVTGDGARNYVLMESYRRPEMARFRRRLTSRYRPPASKSVLLLVPCSRTKPYRRSRSHRRLRSSLEGVEGLERLHVVSVSSPVGVVPRELEDVSPAAHYDVPVTGDWAEDERNGVIAGLRHLVTTGSYRAIIVHLEREEYDFVRPALPDGLPVQWTVEDARTLSASSLAALREAVIRSLSSIPPVAGGPLAVVREELRELASVQFGRDAAERLFAPPLRLAGRPWAQRLTDGHIDLATVREERGLFQLTVAGARRMGPGLPLRVSIDPGFELVGDLFAPGVRSASTEIRVGDAVGVFRGDDLAAVGEAALPGRWMTEVGHGVAVRLRHRVHDATDTALTHAPPAPRAGPVVQR